MDNNSKKLLSLEDALKAAGDLLVVSSKKQIAEQVVPITDEKRIYYRTHPVEFCREILNSDPYEKQQEILCSLRDNERTTVRSAHGMGKSWIAGAAVHWFINSYMPSTVITTAPTGRQVRGILWKEIAAQYYAAKVNLGGRMLTQQLIMSTEKKWFAEGFTTDETSLDRFQGFHNDYILVIVDEAAGVGSKIFEAIEGLLSSGYMVRLLLIGNPTDEQTDFGRSFKSKFYKSFHVSVFDSPNFTKFGITLEDFINNTWQQKITDKLPRQYLSNPYWAYQKFITWGMDNPLFRVKVLGEFPLVGDNQFVPLSWVERAMEKEDAERGKKILAVDVANQGEDSSVLCIRDGNIIEPLKEWQHKDTMETAGIVKNEIDKIKPDAVNIDYIGVGNGVCDRLKELGYDINAIIAGATAHDPEHYFNLRSEMYWNVRNALEKNEIKLPEDNDLAAEITGIQFEFTSKGQFKVEPKKDTKERIGRSPDKFDAVAMSFAGKGSNIVSYGSLNSIFSDRPSESNTYIQVSNSLEEAFDLIDMKNRKLPIPNNFDYNKNNRVCVSCGYKEGLVYSKNNSLVNPGEETKIKCLICGAVMEKE